MVLRAELVERIQSLSAAERKWQPTAEEWLKKQPLPDEPGDTGLDRTLIALDEPNEVRSRTESLACTEAQLRAAVHAVGNSADAVRAYLKSQGPSS